MTLPTSGTITKADLHTETQTYYSDINDDIQHAARRFLVPIRFEAVTDSTDLKDRSATFYVDDTCRVDMLGVQVYSTTASSRTSTVKLRAITRDVTDFAEAMEDRTVTVSLTTTATGWDDSRTTYVDVTAGLYYLRPGVLYELSVTYSDSSGADAHEGHLVCSSRRRRR